MIILITGQVYVRSYCKNQYICTQGAEIIPDFWCLDQWMNCSLLPWWLSSTLQCYHLQDNRGLDHQVHTIKWQLNINASSLSSSGWRILGHHQGAPQTRVGCMISPEVHGGSHAKPMVPAPFCKWACAWPCAAGESEVRCTTYPSPADLLAPQSGWTWWS